LRGIGDGSAAATVPNMVAGLPAVRLPLNRLLLPTAYTFSYDIPGGRKTKYRGRARVEPPDSVRLRTWVRPAGWPFFALALALRQTLDLPYLH